MTYPGQEANHGLQLISSNRITNKGQRFTLNNLKKLSRVKQREFTLIGLPPPLHKLRIWPPILHAILVFMDGPTACVCVIWSIRVGDPFTREEVAFRPRYGGQRLVSRGSYLIMNGGSGGGGCCCRRWCWF